MKLLSEFDKSSKVKVSCIYKITNILNGKIYIGMTVNFRTRISDYENSSKKKVKYGMYAIIDKIGSDNFTIEVIEFCSPEKIIEREEYYIKKLDACNPEIGYNTNSHDYHNTEESRKNKSKSHIGLKESPDTKKKKSNTILAIKGDEIIICDSGKLFGDFIGSSKDMIKNCLRQPSRIQDYRLYYSDYEKRQAIRKKMMKKRCIRDKGYIEMLDILDSIEESDYKKIFKFIYKLIYVDDKKYKLTMIIE